MNDILNQIKSDERGYESLLSSAAKHICEHGEIKLVLIAGGSCSGKTTTTRKLLSLINENGRTAHMVSLDDYYRNLDESVYLSDGTRDIESLASLRTDMIRASVKSLVSCRRTAIPRFDFLTTSRKDTHRYITPAEGDAVIIEGLHALNTSLFSDLIGKSGVYKIYLYAECEGDVDCRFIRRLVRDSIHRGSDAEELFRLWDNVKANEKNSIEPFRKDADLEINTYFGYEKRILNNSAAALLEKIPPESPYYANARELISSISPVPQISGCLIPENSLLHEFI